MSSNDHSTKTSGTENDDKNNAAISVVENNADNNNGAIVIDEKHAERESPNGPGSKPKPEIMKVKLNPFAKEFFPSSYCGDRMVGYSFNQHMGNDGFSRRRNTQVTRLNRNSNRAQREDCIRRTVYINDVDHNVSEDMLASVFHSKCGYVVDCRICGDPRSPLRFAFVEFKDERGAKEAVKLCGTVVGSFSIKVSPSKTAILPVNPIYLPKSADELAMVARTVYCSNIDKLVTYAYIKFFFETFCGKVTRLRLLGDYMHSTCIAFVEFATVDSAITALSCSGAILGHLPIRVNPSKTPVRPRPRHD